MSDIIKLLEEFAKKLPKFPDGRIDYTKAEKVPVVDVWVKHKDKILLVKRSDKVANYQGKWNVVSGYLDEIKPLKQKAAEELQEELGIEKDSILSLDAKQPYNFVDEGRTWIVHPVLAELKEKPEIKLDWEHTEYKWILPEELETFDIIPDLKQVIKKLIEE